ncbi:MAG: hypothetical protein JXL97_19435 [Bacteroidales bacterium]|nr:hypothetical protein [Bacteroidales bacterium]
MDLEKIKDDYCKSAIAHRKASFQGEYKTANKEAKKLKEFFTLFLENKIDKKILVELLENEKVAIATWAAAHLLGLKYEMKKAEALLTKISNSDHLGMISFNAKMTLKVWKEKGELTF